MIGIYKITNTLNGKMYIGSSNNIERRWKEHRKGLAKGDHHSIKLQRAWNKYGEQNFEFEVMEECDAEKLLYLEQFYIDKYRVYFEGYNCKELTKSMITMADYERSKVLEKYHNYIMAWVDRGYLYFSDKKTGDRILLDKYKDNEYIWYTDIMAFINCIIKEYEFCEIQNDRKEDESYFIDFDINSGYLPFTIFIKGDLRLKFEYILDSRKIYLNECLNSKWMDVDNSEWSNILLGSIYDMSEADIKESSTYTIDIQKYTDEYFKLYTLHVFPFYTNERYINRYSHLPEFQDKLKDYLKREYKVYNAYVKERDKNKTKESVAKSIEECRAKASK